MDDKIGLPASIESAKTWLEEILQSRISGNIRFDVETAGRYTSLRLENYSGLELRMPIYEGFWRRGTTLSHAQWIPEREGFQSPLGAILPMPGVSQAVEPLVAEHQYGLIMHYDLPGLIYWMFTRVEEVGRTDLDQHGRFASSSSHAFQNGYLERPIVDEWICVLRQLVTRLWPELPLINSKFSVRVSHDVDLPTSYGFTPPLSLARMMAADVLKHGDFGNASKAIWIRLMTGSTLHPSDPSNTFEWLMDQSDNYGLQSAFYFICGRTDAKRDAFYDVGHPAIRALLRRIYSRGHEIGLHPSYNTYLNPASIALEAKRLRDICAEEGIVQRIVGGRMHFLRWKHPTTLYGWEQAGMNYDSTLSYADRPGFRCGTCHDYRAFDPEQGRALNLQIRPLVAMECTVMAQRYMGLGTGDNALKKFVQLKDACRAVSGSFTLLWHNSSFRLASERELYQKILAA